MNKTNLLPSPLVNRVPNPIVNSFNTIEEEVNPFIKAELFGRSYFNKIAATMMADGSMTNYAFTTEEMCGWDVEWNTVDGWTVLGEIKKRDVPISTYKDWIMEEHKYQVIESEVMRRKAIFQNDKFIGAYINIFSDHSFLIWYYSLLPLKVRKSYSKRSTCGNSDYTNKYYIDLPANSAHFRGFVTPERAIVYYNQQTN